MCNYFSFEDLFADGDDFSWETIEKNRNIYYQKQLANQILDQMNALISKITSAINIHLTLNQNFLVNTSEVFLLIEKRTFQSLSNLKLEQTDNARMELPTIFYNDSSVLLRVGCLFTKHFSIISPSLSQC